jgi:hypothetical protein
METAYKKFKVADFSNKKFVPRPLPSEEPVPPNEGPNEEPEGPEGPPNEPAPNEPAPNEGPEGPPPKAPPPCLIGPVVTAAAKALVTLPATEEPIVLVLPEQVEAGIALPLTQSLDHVAVAVNRSLNKDREDAVPDPPNARIGVVSDGGALKQAVKVWQPAPYVPDDKEPVVQDSPVQTQSHKKTGGKTPSRKHPFSDKKVPPPPPPKEVIEVSTETSSADPDASSGEDSDSSDPDFVPPGQYLPPSPPPSADIPPLPGKQPKKVKVSRKALAIGRLRKRLSGSSEL